MRFSVARSCCLKILHQRLDVADFGLTAIGIALEVDVLIPNPAAEFALSFDAHRPAHLRLNSVRLSQQIRRFGRMYERDTRVIPSARTGTNVRPQVIDFIGWGGRI